MKNFIVSPYMLICLAASVVAFAAACISWKRSEAPGGKTLALFLLLVSIWTGCSMVEYAVVGLALKMNWARIAACVFTLCPPLLLIMAAQYNRYDRWLLTQRRRYLLYIVPFVDVLLILTNERHHLVWTGVKSSMDGANMAIFEHGPAYWIGVAGYSYLVISFAVVFLVISVFRYPQAYRNQSFFLLFGILVPWAGNLAHVAGLGPLPGLDLTPLVIVFMGSVITWNLSCNRLFDLMPVARETLIDTTPDGMLVLDGQGRLVDFNAAARHLLAGQVVLEIGKPGHRLFARWPELVPFLTGNFSGEHEMTLKDGRGGFIEWKIIPIGYDQQNSAGRLIVLRDCTHAVLIEDEINITNELLRTQLDEIELLQENLRERAVRDSLTGLFNRRYLVESMRREFARAVREQSSINVCMIDLDHFKDFNDTHGHLAGDMMLKNLGSILGSNTRVDDITCRYGGEEFVIVIPMLTSQEALQCLEELRRVFQKTPAIYRDEPFFATFSAGIATYPEHGSCPQDIMMAADRALYEAKSSGRNCVRLAGGNQVIR